MSKYLDKPHKPKAKPRKRAKCPECHYWRYLRADGLCATCAGTSGGRNATHGGLQADPSPELRDYFADRAARQLPLFGDDEGRFAILRG